MKRLELAHIFQLDINNGEVTNTPAGTSLCTILTQSRLTQRAEATGTFQLARANLLFLINLPLDEELLTACNNDFKELFTFPSILQTTTEEDGTSNELLGEVYLEVGNSWRLLGKLFHQGGKNGEGQQSCRCLRGIPFIIRTNNAFIEGSRDPVLMAEPTCIGLADKGKTRFFFKHNLHFPLIPAPIIAPAVTSTPAVTPTPVVTPSIAPASVVAPAPVPTWSEQVVTMVWRDTYIPGDEVALQMLLNGSHSSDRRSKGIPGKLCQLGGKHNEIYHN
ncbi:hypothetical protein PTI98_011484 [Pleurotus ostreatus]|nr:hypothetical protein PTI98_011484 [Pleurotus ostreatus]